MIGPLFTREVALAPRRASFYAAPTVFVGALFALTLASWQLLVGSQRLDNVGDLAWFGAAVFQILAPLQLAVVVPFSALLVASAVALEKDRKTLDLLLMTRLANSELVLGKLLAAMLTVFVVIVAALPLLAIVALLGGVSMGQILRVQAVTLASALVAGSLASLVALWREKTFQALAMTALLLVLWLVGWEIVNSGALGERWLGLPASAWSISLSPWQAVQVAAQPRFADENLANLLADPVCLFLIASFGATALLNGWAIARVRVWNPSQDFTPRIEADGNPASLSTTNVHSASGKVRPVWDNPILWREIRTWAYGKKILLIRLAYWAMFAICVTALAMNSSPRYEAASDAVPADARPLTALLLISLILLNALAVTSLTSERDTRALDLLLVTDLSPKEIVYGKLGGAFYNAKEMIVLPIVLCVYLWYADRLSTENLVFLTCGLLTMNAFAAMLGLHAGITYANSRTAIAVSIGTLLFLFLGIAACMRIMLAFSNSFDYQFTAFISFIAGGSVGLFVALGWRNPSRAIFWASVFTPFVTFFIITSFLLENYGAVFLLTVATYGFATGAMLVPAVSEFDVATGRTTAREE